ncbi:MAG: hypothetical protein ABI648_16470 [Betaproteobacteria bacterium]
MMLSTRQAAVVMATMLGFACATAGAARLTILAPAQHDTIHDNSGNMVVTVRVDPPLDPQDGTSIRILLDGKNVTAKKSGAGYALTGVDRGEHSVQAALVDRNGQTLRESEPVQFTMWQASISNPARHKK